ncbi:unnamed protein product, partial [Pylaiella littoralis]
VEQANSEYIGSHRVTSRTSVVRSATANCRSFLAYYRWSTCRPKPQRTGRKHKRQLIRTKCTCVFFCGETAVCAAAEQLYGTLADAQAHIISYHIISYFEVSYVQWDLAEQQNQLCQVMP